VIELSSVDEKRVYVLCDPKIQNRDICLESWIYHIHQNEGINVQNRDIPVQNGDSRKISFSQDGWTMGISLYMIAVIMVIDFKKFEFKDYPVPDNIQEWMKS